MSDNIHKIAARLTKEASEILNPTTKAAMKTYDEIVRPILEQTKFLRNSLPIQISNQELSLFESNVSALETLVDVQVRPTLEEVSISTGNEQLEELLELLIDEVRGLRSDINTLENKQIVSLPIGKIRRVRGANMATQEKISKLASYRQNRIDEYGSVPGWISACQSINIDPRTVINHVPDLRKKWENREYRWENNFD